MQKLLKLELKFNDQLRLCYIAYVRRDFLEPMFDENNNVSTVLEKENCESSTLDETNSASTSNIASADTLPVSSPQHQSFIIRFV